MKHSPNMKNLPKFDNSDSLRKRLSDETIQINFETDASVKLGLLKSFKESLENEIILLIQLNQTKSESPKNRLGILTGNLQEIKERLIEIREEFTGLMKNLNEMEKIKTQILEEKNAKTKNDSKLLPEFVKRKSGAIPKTPFMTTFKTMVRKGFNDMGLIKNS